MTITFKVLGPPKAKAKRFTTINGKPRGFIDKETTAYQESIARAALAAKGDWPSPYMGLIDVSITAVFPRPKYLLQVNKRTGCLKSSPDRIPYRGKPDLDNVIKAVLDGLKWAGIMRDDSQVNSLDGSRRYYAAIGEAPHTEVTIRMTEA